MVPLKWFKQKKEDDTIVGSSPKGKPPKIEEDETLVASSPIKKKVQEDETIMASRKKDSLSHELHQVLEEKGENTLFSSKPRLSIVQRWSMKLSQKKAQTILSTALPLEDYELEAVRTQTLVSLHSTPSVIEWPTSLKEKELEKIKAGDLLKILNSYLARKDITGQNRLAINQLKNALIVRTKLLTEESILINIINQGYRSFCHTLDRLSLLTSGKKINKKIWDYLHQETENRLMEQSENFRKQILSMKNCEELTSLLDKYTLKSTTILKKYPSLKIISDLKNIQKSYQSKPDRLIAILNQFLGTYGEVNIKEKLSRLLLTSEVDAKICKEILRLNTLPELLQKLEKLKNTQETSSTANKLLTLIRTYIEPGEKVAFSSFATSLNIFSPALSQKALSIVRHGIAKELKGEIHSLLQSQESSLSRLLNLLKLLKNPRYEDPSVLIFGYSPSVLSDKIQSINPAVGPDLERVCKHILSSSEIPANFISLVLEGKKAQYKASRWG